MSNDHDVSTAEAILRAVAVFKNDPEFTSGAYGTDDEDHADETPEERKERPRRRRRLLAEAAERAGLPATRKRDLSMIDTGALIQKVDDDLIAMIKKRGCGLAALDEYVTKGLGQWSESQVTKIINDQHGADAVKKMTEQSAEGEIIRKALQKANIANWNAHPIV
jgi:hypothetical protein